MTRSSEQQPNDSSFSWTKAVLYPNLYLWLIFVSALDVVLTRVILFFGGTEVNPIADWILGEFGRMGMSLFKFIIVAFVVVCCEIVGRQKWRVGRNLARASIIISMAPVVWSSFIILSLIMNPPPLPDLPEDPSLSRIPTANGGIDG
ncbi:MAG: DUF5658 family protein [Planctomycetota bacterium]|nr:DUF5658 family protein [Planctomycetota bacterium]